MEIIVDYKGQFYCHKIVVNKIAKVLNGFQIPSNIRRNGIVMETLYAGACVC